MGTQPGITLHRSPGPAGPQDRHSFPDLHPRKGGGTAPPNLKVEERKGEIPQPRISNSGSHHGRRGRGDESWQLSALTALASCHLARLLGDAILGKPGLHLTIGDMGGGGWESLAACQQDAESQTQRLEVTASTRPGGGAANPPPPRARRGRPGPAYLVRSAPGWRPKPDGDSEGAAGPSGGCSGRGDGRGAASSAGGAGGCMVGGAQDAFLPAEEPLRATQDVSMTLTPMLARDTKTPAYPRVTRSGRPPPRRGHIQARPPGEQQRSLSTLLGPGSEAGPRRCAAPAPGCSRAWALQRPRRARRLASSPCQSQLASGSACGIQARPQSRMQPLWGGLPPSPEWEMEVGRRGGGRGQHRTRTRWHRPAGDV